MTASISYINLSWAVVGIIDKDVRNGLQSMKRPDTFCICGGFKEDIL